MNTYPEFSKKIQDLLDLKGQPVSIKFLKKNVLNIPETEENRFCQTVLDASNGKIFVVRLYLRCFTPNLLFGFRSSKYYKKMSLKKYDFKFLHVAPLKTVSKSDLVLLIVNPYQVMQLIIAFHQIIKRKLNFNLSGSAAICGEATLSIYLRKKPSISFLCFGARIYNNYSNDEMVFGFPIKFINKLVKKLEKNAEYIKTMEKYDKEL
ncbi:MAG: DUF169 domain-containing protein [Candidatus Helarchaeota archaeon]